MRFWTREIVGWLLVLLGLFGFYVCFVMLTERQIVQSSFMTFISVIVFRGGIHLVKVAVAARICLQAQAHLAQQPPAPLASSPPPRSPARAVLGQRAR